MKKSILLFTFLMITNLAFSQLDRQWNGASEIQGTKLRIIFHIQKVDEKYTATFDSPDQNAYGLPTEEVIFNNPGVIIKIPIIGGVFKGQMSDDNTEISGRLKQGELSIPLNLKAVDSETGSVARPQTPKKPYPYYSRELIIQNTKDNIQLAGTLTLPDSIGMYPIVVLISGSGSQDRDETIFGHKPFLVLADYLTRNGIGVLRFDDRHYRKPPELLFNTTPDDIANDVESCINFLQSHNHVLKNSIGLIGHSEGGLSASIVAARNSDLAYIVLLASSGIEGEEIIYAQTMAIFETLTEEEKKEQVELRRELINVLKIEPDKEIAIEMLSEILNRDLSITIQHEVADTIQEIENSIEIFNSDMFRFFISYDPVNDLRKITCPVLALIGEKDIQVSSQENLPVIESILKESGNDNYMVKEIPNVNHLFQTAITGKVTEYGEIEETISPDVLALILSWIKDLEK